jgi:integrase
MIQLQLLTGMRPGQVTVMRTGDLDRTSEIWSYVPQRHKTEHICKERRIYLGPKAQSILQPWLRNDLSA